MNTEEIRITTPPYASVSKMNEMFDLLNTRSFQGITSADLQNRGFSTSDAFQVLAALKFLGLLNEDNTKTDILPKIQLRGEQRTAAMKEIVTNSYSSLFSVAPQANKLQRDELHNEIMAVYGVSTRIANAAAPLFLWICKQAGLEVTEDIAPRDRKKHVKPHNTTLTYKEINKNDDHHIQSNNTTETDIDYHIYPIGRIKLLIPSEERYLSPIMNGGLKDIKVQIEKFIKVIEDKTEETPVGSGSQA